ncbi:MAG TPA: competence type IV pilus minor pilin ComGG [Bacillota bacterium]|nr:competence type IV pilus minor pilin ComGG [Bacillota bacterium]
MKNQSFFTNNDNGFFYPYVMFITAILFIVTTANINIYSNEIHLTKQLIEQTKIETLIQMGLTTFKEDVTTFKHPEGTVSYEFPSGQVNIAFSTRDERYMQLDLKIETDTNYRHEVVHIMRLSRKHKD